MSDNRRVKFSTSPTPRGILKQPDSHPRDSGVGSSSSDHTGSSGSLDEKFTARDYNIQSNNVDALREALADAIKDIQTWRGKYDKKSAEHLEARKELRGAQRLYQEAFEKNNKLEDRVKSLNDRMDDQDTALEVANSQIASLDAELEDWKDKYKQLDDLYESMRRSPNPSIISGGSGDHSLGLGPLRGGGGVEMIPRMKERINRDQTDSGSSHRSSRSSDATTSSTSKRTVPVATTSSSSKRLVPIATTSTNDPSKPYIEKMPSSSSSKTAHSTSLASPRQPGNYTFTTVVEPYPSSSSSSRRHGTGSSSRHPRHEGGDYVAHPLPDRSRRIS